MRRRTGERGQATAELALLLPLVALALLAVVQVGLVVRARIMVTHAAREGARVAAVGGSSGEVARAARAAGGLVAHRVSVDVRSSGDDVVVEVRYADPTDVPLVGPLIGDAELHAVARMRREEPP